MWSTISFSPCLEITLTILILCPNFLFKLVVIVSSGKDDNCRIEAYVNSGSQEKNKSIFDALFNYKDVIEKDYGATLIWQRLDEKVTCRIYEDRPLSYTNENDRPAIFEFFCDATNRMLKSFDSHAKLFKSW